MLRKHFSQCYVNIMRDLTKQKSKLIDLCNNIYIAVWHSPVTLPLFFSGRHSYLELLFFKQDKAINYQASLQACLKNKAQHEIQVAKSADSLQFTQETEVPGAAECQGGSWWQQQNAAPRVCNWDTLV